MQILWISHFLLYPDTGYGALQRSKNLLKCLGTKSEVILICLVREYDRQLAPSIEVAYKDLKNYCTEVYFIQHKVKASHKIKFLFKNVLTGTPYSVFLYRSKELLAVVKSILSNNKIDLIHADTIGLIEQSIKEIESVKVLNHHDIESHKMSRRTKTETNILKKLFYYYESYCIKKYEKRYCKEYDLNIVVSEVDKSRLQEIEQDIKIEVVANGVDCDYFQFSSRENSNEELIFTGTLDYYPNSHAIIYFFSDVWPFLKKKYPDMKLTIIGKNPPITVVDLVNKYKDVTLCGYVPDVRPYIKNASIYICPIQDGGGTRLKILDALAQGIPVVSTEMGAEGLHLDDGIHLLIGNTPDEFLEKISILIDNPALSKTISTNGRMFVEKNYSYSVIGEKFTSIYKALIESGKRSI